MIPLSLRAFEGEGEEKTEGHTCAYAQVCPSSLVLREGRKLVPAHPPCFI